MDIKRLLVHRYTINSALGVAAAAGLAAHYVPGAAGVAGAVASICAVIGIASLLCNNSQHSSASRAAAALQDANSVETLQHTETAAPSHSESDFLIRDKLAELYDPLTQENRSEVLVNAVTDMRYIAAYIRQAKALDELGTVKSTLHLDKLRTAKSHHQRARKEFDLGSMILQVSENDVRFRVKSPRKTEQVVDKGVFLKATHEGVPIIQ